MNANHKRQIRITHLRQAALRQNLDETQIYVKARLMGVSPATAKDYARVVIHQIRSLKK